MYKIAPSLLEADFRCLERQLDILKKAKADYIHLDVMDGCFVPNLSFGLGVIRSIRKASDLFFDVHMMVKEPIRFIADLKVAGADHVSVHYEACMDIKATIKAIKDEKMGCGIALKPETPIQVLTDEILESVDVIHLMTVKPGIPNQFFMEESLDRIKGIKKQLDKRNMERSIEVDGDITLKNLEKVLCVGANIIVSGKGIFYGDIEKNIKDFKRYRNGE